MPLGHDATNNTFQAMLHNIAAVEKRLHLRALGEMVHCNIVQEKVSLPHTSQAICAVWYFSIYTLGPLNSTYILRCELQST